MKYIAIISLCTLISVQASAQREDNTRKRERTSISFGGQVGLPNGEFAQEFRGNTYGIGGSFLTKTQLPYIYSGLNFTYARLDRFTDDIYLQEGQTMNGVAVYEAADVAVNHNVYRTHLNARFKPFKGQVQPYVEGLAGMRIFSSNVKLTSGEGQTEVVLDKYALERSFSTSFGWAAGVKVQAAPRLFVEAKYTKLEGGKASYVDFDSLTMNSTGDFSYDMNNSKTNTSLIHLGISWDIYPKR